MDSEELLGKIEQLKTKAYINVDTLSAKYPSWDKATDVRLTIFAKSGNVMMSVYLSLLFWIADLAHSEWWKARANTDVSDQDQEFYLREYGVFVRLGCIHLMTSAIESSMRAIIRVYSPGQCKNGYGSFKSIYDHILGRLKLTKWIPVLDMLRTVRNTIHNNSIYEVEHGRPAQVEYRGTTYMFSSGKLHDAASWPTLIDILTDLEAMMLDVIEHPDISTIGAIEDPVAILVK